MPKEAATGAKYEAESGDLTLVASGDSMITRRLAVFREPSFTALFDTFRQADVGFTNLEMLMHEYEHSPGMAGGTFTASDPKNLDDLKWGGINLVSCANNHSYDYGEGGLLTNLKHLRASGIAHAGTGRNLSEARAPGYLDTARGRVALISVSSTFPETARALDQRPDIKGRPGINALRFSSAYTVDRTAFDQARRMSTELGLETKKDEERKLRFTGAVPEDTDTEFHLFGNKLVLGEEFRVATTPHDKDLEENLKWIREARRMADWVLVSFHCHESGANREEPPEFLVEFARACIDEGAHAFIGHGPHVTRGIEIHSGRPIFYSLGDFIFQNDTVLWQPSYNYDLVKLGPEATPADFYDARSDDGAKGYPAESIYWEGLVAKCEYGSGRLRQITLLPVDLGYGRPRSQRGRPMLAKGEVARRILERIKTLSEPFGTKVKTKGARGIISVAAS